MSYDAMVSELIGLGVPHDKATARAAAEYPEAARVAQGAHVRRLNVLEKDEQRECVKIFKAHGCEVYNLSQSRATKQTPGIPDTLVFSPRTKAAFWFEVKRPDGGVASAAQREFQQHCERCGVAYVIGGVVEAWAKMTEMELTS